MQIDRILAVILILGDTDEHVQTHLEVLPCALALHEVALRLEHLD
jgi:hypothetical protein